MADVSKRYGWAIYKANGERVLMNATYPHTLDEAEQDARETLDGIIRGCYADLFQMGNQAAALNHEPAAIIKRIGN